MIQNETISAGDPLITPGHPLHTLRAENLAIEGFLAGVFKAHLEMLDTDDSPELRQLLIDDINQLAMVEAHYNRINDLLMPHIVAVAGVAPKMVLLSIQQDVLRMIRALSDDLKRPDSEAKGIRAFTAFLIRDIEIIIRQERESYAQEARKIITDAQWREIYKAEKAYGYCMIEPPVEWESEQQVNPSQVKRQTE